MTCFDQSLQPNDLGIGCSIQIDEDHLELPVNEFEDLGKLRPVYGYLPVAVQMGGFSHGASSFAVAGWNIIPPAAMRKNQIPHRRTE